MPMTFEQFMEKVSEIIEDRVGLSSDDLPDMRYRDLFDQGFTPDEVANMAISYAADGSYGYDVELEE